MANTMAVRLSDHGEMETTKSFGELLRQATGEAPWARLDATIPARFSITATHNGILRFVGTVHWAYCSLLGAILGRLIEPLSVLPHQSRRNADFTFVIKHTREGILKERTYCWPDGTRFVFRSRFGEFPFLHEEFRAGFGMYLKLSAVGGALLFSDNGYYLRLGKHRLRLPRWLDVGRFELLHRSIDARRFQVLIRVSHPLFGTLFYQRGEFWGDPR